MGQFNFKSSRDSQDEDEPTPCKSFLIGPEGDNVNHEMDRYIKNASEEILSLVKKEEVIDILEIKESKNTNFSWTLKTIEEKAIIQPLIDGFFSGKKLVKELHFFINRMTNVEVLVELITALKTQKSFNTLEIHSQLNELDSPKLLGKAITELLIQTKLSSLSLQGPVPDDLYEFIFSTAVGYSKLENLKIEIPCDNEKLLQQLVQFMLNNISLRSLLFCYDSKAGRGSFLNVQEKLYLLYGHPSLERIDVMSYDGKSKKIFSIEKDKFQKLRKMWERPYYKHMDNKNGKIGYFKLFNMMQRKQKTNMQFYFKP